MLKTYISFRAISFSEHFFRVKNLLKSFCFQQSVFDCKSDVQNSTVENQKMFKSFGALLSVVGKNKIKSFGALFQKRVG